jgi:hypothetical protein
MSLTFITAFIDLEDDKTKNKSIETRFSHFSTLSSSGISLVVFLSRSHMDKAIQAPHIRYIPIDLCDLLTYKESMEEPLKLPINRTSHKDTLEYMILINSKIEFIQKAIDLNHFQSTHFAWIDFSIFHVIKDVGSSLSYLRMLSNSKFADRFITAAGCWDLGVGRSYIHDAINWRYCGGFFLGDIESLQEFYRLYRIYFPKYLKETKTMLWEVNIWHKMELDGWKCVWYKADHNDSILRIPSSLITSVSTA